MRNILIPLLFLLTCSLFSENVDKDELFQVKKGSVEFLNYEGPHTKFDTREEIIGIGTYMGSVSNRNYLGRYSVIHTDDPTEDGKRNADIFIIHKDAQIDHIRNLRWIIAGYIEKTYGYSLEDSLILAEFVTYYNAVFRGRIDYFAENFKQVVMDHLTETQSGLSTKYSDWPGKSQILIPLTENAFEGGLSSLDTDELADEEVIADLREDEDKGIDPRKELTELREREIEEEQDAIETERDAIETEQGRLDDELEEIEAERESLENSDSTPENLERISDLEDRETGIDTEQEDLDTRTEDLDTRETLVEERQSSIAEERENIAEDEQSIVDNEITDNETDSVSDNSSSVTIPFLYVSDAEDDYFGTISLINNKTGVTETEGTINTIRNRTYTVVEDSIIVIAGIDDGVRAVRLVKINSKTLEVESQGADDVFPDSIIKVSGSSLFSVVKSGNSWVLGKFDEDLKLIQKSEISVAPYTAIILSGNNIYVQNENGKVIILSETDLTGE